MPRMYLAMLIPYLKSKAKTSMYCTFIDYSNDFDNLWREGSWRKMLDLGIYTYAINNTSFVDLCLSRIVASYHLLSIKKVHFKRLGSRHFVKEMKIQSSMLRYNMILRKTNLKPFRKYIQMVSTHPDYQI